MNNTNAIVTSAAALIREVSPFLAAMFVSRPFNRPTVVKSLFEQMRAADPEGDSAYRVRVLLNRSLDLLAAERAADEAAQA